MPPTRRSSRRSSTAVRSPEQVPLLDTVLARPAAAGDRARRPGRGRWPLNAPARAVAPALRRGEPVSLALRMPEILDAIRRAIAQRRAAARRVLRARAVDRWYEAIVVPVALRGRRCSRRRGWCWSRSTTSRRCGGSRRCAPTSSPMPATNCARRWRRCRASSRRCRARRATIPRRATRFLVDHAGAGDAHGAADRRPAVAVAHRAQRASAARHAGRARAASCARWSTACRRWRATARSRSSVTRVGRSGRGARRPRRTDARVREPDRERAEIWRLRQARRDRARPPTAPRQRGAGRRCATMGPASRPSICRG